MFTILSADDADMSSLRLLEAETRVIDGDTIRAQVEGESRRVRIVGLDAPEVARNNTSAECWASESTAALRALVASGELSMAKVRGVDDVDKYGRLLRRLENDGQDIGLMMVAAGHARVGAGVDNAELARAYRAAEDEARQARRGLWSVCP